MVEVKDYLKRVLDRTHYHREMFADANLPSSFSKFRFVVFFGGPCSEFILSSFILPRLVNDSYLVVCSWPGHSSLYPYANEFWTITDDSALSDLVRHIHQGGNERTPVYETNLLKYFDNVDTGDDILNQYYVNGFTKKHYNEFPNVQMSLPHVPSVNMSWQNVADRSKKTIVLMPSKYMVRWLAGKPVQFVVPESFWIKLIDGLLAQNYLPVLLHNYRSHDLTHQYQSKVVYLSELNIGAIMGVMRSSDCVLDVFNGLSRYAIMARSPYLLCDERQKYYHGHEYQIDEVFARELPKSCLFSFAPFKLNDTTHHSVDAIINKLNDFLPSVQKEHLPSTINQVKNFGYDELYFRITKSIENVLIPAPDYYDE